MMRASLRPAVAALAFAVLAACGSKSTPAPTPPPPPPPSCGATTTTVTASQPWQRFTAADWSGTCSLTVEAPALAPGERLAVLLAHAEPGAADRSPATVTAAGTGTPSLSPATPPLASLAAGVAGADSPGDEDALDAGARRGEALVTALREETITRSLDGRLPRILRTVAPAPAAQAPLLPRPTYCMMRWGAVPVTTTNPEGRKRYWLPATLAYESAHAAFYYTDEVAAGIDLAVATRTGVAPSGVTPFWGELAAAYEARVLPKLNTYFGAESDVDGNGKVIFLFGNNGAVTSGATKSFVFGYFWSADLVSPLATDAASCEQDINGAVGNRADLLYLMDPGNYAVLANADPSTRPNVYRDVLNSLVTENYPSVMAHELQHNVNYATRFLRGGPSSVREELWLNEGLSMLSETVAGYGLHTSSSRSAVRFYLGEVDPNSGSAQVVYHRNYGLTTWESDPRGNYAAVQAYMQYLLDHASPAMTRALLNPALAGKANVTAATGVAWETGFARFVTASMFSNEDTAANPPGALFPGTISSAGNVLAGSTYSYLGDGSVSPDYVPWHHYTGFCTTPAPESLRVAKPRLAYVAYTPLSAGIGSSVTLRKDGWAAFATGPGSGAAASVTVQSTASVPPQVVVVRYTGALPTFTPLSTTCP